MGMKEFADAGGKETAQRRECEFRSEHVDLEHFMSKLPGKKRTYKEIALVILAGSLLTGCLARSEGGSLTRAGMTALEGSDYNTALADFTQAVANGEDKVMAYRGLGLTLMGLARYEEAVAAFDKALEAADAKMPETVRDITIYQISARYRAGDYPEVVSECTRLLDEEETLEPCYYLGAAYLAMSDLEEARSCFDRAVALKPGDYSLYLQIYELYEKQNLTAVGDEYLQQALKTLPKSAEDSYHIGLIQFYLKKYEEARNALIDPVNKNYLPALQLLGEIYLAQEDYVHAVATYEQIMEQSGESPTAYNGLALCALASGDYDGALSYIGKGLAMEEDEGRQQLLFDEIVVYERKLDFATALAKAQAYNALYPTDEAGKKELQFLNTRGK